MKRLNYFFLAAFLIILSGLAANFLADYSVVNEAAVKSAVSSVVVGEKYSGLIAERRALESARAREIRLIFVGDIMLGRGVAHQIQKNGGDYKFPFLLVKDFLVSADLAFGNLEGPISDKGENQGSVYSFRFSPEVVSGLEAAGFDVLNLANNHIWDWGREALNDTPAILNNAGIKTIGVGKNYEEANQAAIFDLNGTRIAFLGYTNLYPKSLMAGANNPGVSDFDLENVKKLVVETKKTADLVVVSWHWGEEYQPHLNSSQQRLARAILDAGADLVVGHHPHVPEEVEQYQGKWIAYSLGNFVFDQNFSEETMAGMVLEVLVKDKEIFDVKPAYFKINSVFQPVLGSGR